MEKFRIIEEFMQFLAERKKWWLLPVVAALGLIAALVFLSESPVVGPFIYTVF